MSITKTSIVARIQSLENQIVAKRSVLRHLLINIEELTARLPIERELAFPKDKSETTQAAKDCFKDFLNVVNASKKIHRDTEAEIIPLQKTISSFNYILHQQEEAKKFITDDYKVLVIDLEDTNVAPNISIAAIGDKSQFKTVLLGDCPLEDLMFNIEQADKVVTFAREDAIEKLNDLGIEVTKEDRKFTSIHHLMRGFTNFQREGLALYADIVGFELTDDNAYNLMMVYCAIVDIQTLDEEIIDSNNAVESMLEQMKQTTPMIDELSSLVEDMEISDDFTRKYIAEDQSMSSKIINDSIDRLVKDKG